jgi:hypothetical protein
VQVYNATMPKVTESEAITASLYCDYITVLKLAQRVHCAIVLEIISSNPVVAKWIITFID